jgi:hypothetical protein
MEMNQALYQKIYDTRYKHYGEAAFNCCPGVRLFPHYEEYLESPIIDMGCGTGDTVFFLRGKGYKVCGIDWAGANFFMQQGDITKSGDYSISKTCLCMDVLEHIQQVHLGTVFANMSQSKTHIFSISNTPSIVEIDGKEYNCHVTDWPFEKWDRLIRINFRIIERKQIRDCQILYITEKKQ